MPKKTSKGTISKVIVLQNIIGRELVSKWLIAKSLASHQQNLNEKAKKINILVLIMQRENYVAHKLSWMTDEYYYM